MGVVNVTPDSFSDGGRWFTPGAAVAHGLELVEQGADLLDVGGESTRPGARRVAGRRRAGPRAAGDRAAGGARCDGERRHDPRGGRAGGRRARCLDRQRRVGRAGRRRHVRGRRRDGRGVRRDALARARRRHGRPRRLRRRGDGRAARAGARGSPRCVRPGCATSRWCWTRVWASRRRGAATGRCSRGCRSWWRTASPCWSARAASGSSVTCWPARTASRRRRSRGTGRRLRCRRWPLRREPGACGCTRWQARPTRCGSPRRGRVPLRVGSRDDDDELAVDEDARTGGSTR